MRTILILLLFLNTGGASASSDNLQSRFTKCLEHTDEKKSVECLIKNKIMTTDCGKHGSFLCPPATTEKLIGGIELSDSCQLLLMGDSIEKSASLYHPTPRKDSAPHKCVIANFESTSVFIPVDFAKFGTNGKWNLAPPKIPIGLRNHIKLDSIIVNGITRRKPFLLGGGRYYETARDIDICNPTFRSFTHRPGQLRDGTVHEYFSLRDPDELEAANAVSKAWGLEQSDDFLRNDRHVIGRSRDFNYTVVGGFTLKNDLKICGRDIPKGTMLGLSTYLNERTSVCEMGVDGVLFLVGVPNTEKKAEPGKEPTKTLTCVPKAYFSGNFRHAMNKYISSKNSGKAEVPKKPVVDFNDCECMAKEIEEEEWRD